MARMGFLHRDEQLPLPITGAAEVAPLGAISKNVHENPDPRTDGYLSMIVSEGCGVNMMPKFVELLSNKGKISLFVGSCGFIHISYISPYGDEPEVRLFNGCQCPETAEETPILTVVEAVATEQYAPYVDQETA